MLIFIAGIILTILMVTFLYKMNMSHVRMNYTYKKEGRDWFMTWMCLSEALSSTLVCMIIIVLLLV